MLRRLTLLVLLVLPTQLRADSSAVYISDKYEHAGFDQAVKRVQENPDLHVMVYLGANRCAPCMYTANQVNASEVVARLKSHVVVVEGDAWAPRNEEQSLLAKRFGYRREHWLVASVAPVLAILDHEGQQVVRLVGGVNNSREALLLGDFLAGKHYKRTGFKEFVAENR